jgi:hypothetical protein
MPRKWCYAVSSFLGIAMVALIAITYRNLPEWNPEWVISLSTSPERVLRACEWTVRHSTTSSDRVSRASEWVIRNSSDPEHVLRAASVASNGHFEATPALQNLLGERFADFLVQKLSDPDEVVKEEAACILAHSDHPRAEEALRDAYLRGQSEDMKLSLVFFLGWTATDRSREFLTGILEHRIAGPRWSALRALSRSSITDRYEIISQYLNDPDEDVRKQVKKAFQRKLENEFAAQVAKIAKSQIFPLARRLAETHRGDVPLEQLPKELAGRPIRWGRIYDGVLDLRFEDNKSGLLINPSGANAFPVINRYLIGGDGVNGITPYLVL